MTQLGYLTHRGSVTGSSEHAEVKTKISPCALRRCSVAYGIQGKFSSCDIAPAAQPNPFWELTKPDARCMQRNLASDSRCAAVDGNHSDQSFSRDRLYAAEVHSRSR